MKRIPALLCVLALSRLIGPVGASGEPQARQASTHEGNRQRFERYQVPAGTALLLKLRTPLDSSSAAVDDQVDAVVWSPVIQDGVELIPEGSVVMGRVVEVLAATKRKPLGSIVFTFSILEHAETGDRASVTTRKVTFTARPAETDRKRSTPRELSNAIIPPGTAFVAMTAEPLLVRIPR